MIPERSSFSPGPNTSIKARFTNRFLRALKRLNKHRSNSTTGRYRMVKVAADASMASAVGSKKAWSRAMLWKMRSRQQQRRTARVLGIRRRSRARVLRRRCHDVEDKPAAGNYKFGFGGVHQLRKLVPGGETMDLESLLLETAHYVKCLGTQVQVMRDIVDFCST